MKCLRSVFATTDGSLDSFFKSAFRDAGIEGTVAHAAPELKKALETGFDALLLDSSSAAELTGTGSAEHAVSGLRRLYPGKVIIALEDRVFPGDIVAILNAGASDVASKPARFRAIAEQVKSLTRFGKPSAKPFRPRLSLDDGALVLDVPSRRCFVRRSPQGEPVEVRLTRNEFRILAELLASRGKMVTYRDFRERVWPERSFAGEIRHQLLQHISDLRAKLGSAGRRIHNIWGEGFRIE